MTTRITGGFHGGRVLRTPSVRGLRPTSERVRAALFSIIGPEAIAGKRIADLYSGTGSLGLECLSRGAAWVNFVEQNGKLCAAIRTVLARWFLDRQARVYQGRVLTTIETLPGGYDLVLADPPYSRASYELAQLMGHLQDARLVNPGGLVVLEHRSDNDDNFATGRYTVETSRSYGDTKITVLIAGAVDG